MSQIHLDTLSPDSPNIQGENNRFNKHGQRLGKQEAPAHCERQGTPAILHHDKEPSGKVGAEPAQSEQQILEMRMNRLQGCP